MKFINKIVATVLMLLFTYNLQAAEALTGRPVRNEELDFFDMLMVFVNLLLSGYNMIYFIVLVLGGLFFLRGVWVLYKNSQKQNEDDDRYTVGKGIWPIVIGGIALSFGTWQLASQNTFNVDDPDSQEVIEVEY